MSDWSNQRAIKTYVDPQQGYKRWWVNQFSDCEYMIILYMYTVCVLYFYIVYCNWKFQGAISCLGPNAIPLRNPTAFTRRGVFSRLPPANASTNRRFQATNITRTCALKVFDFHIVWFQCQIFLEATDQYGVVRWKVDRRSFPTTDAIHCWVRAFAWMQFFRVATW